MVQSSASGFAAEPLSPPPADAVVGVGRLGAEDIVRFHNYVRWRKRLALTLFLYGVILAFGVFLAYTENMPLAYGVAFGLLGVVGGYTTNQLVSWSQARKAVRGGAGHQDGRVVLTREGIEESTPVSKSRHSWDSVQGIGRTRHAIYLDMGALMVILPSRYFQGHSLEQVEARLQQWWRPERMRPALP